MIEQAKGVASIALPIAAGENAKRSSPESDDRFDDTADATPALVWVMGAEGVQFVNRAYRAFVGGDESTLHGYGWTDFIHAEDRDAYVGRFLDSFGRRETFEDVCRVRRADGAWRWMKSVGVPRFVRGEFAGYVGASLDITDVKQAELALRDSDRSKDEFLATLAHELRNPLAAVRNAIQVIASAGASDADARAARDVMDRQTRNMVRMVDDLLDVTRIARGAIQLRKEPVELAGVIRHAVAAIRAEIEARAQRLVLALPTEPMQVSGDPTRLEQVVGNLLGNSSKFTPNGGHVDVALARELGPGGAAWAVLTVRDDGIGIAPHLLKGVFGMFTQAERSVERTRSGLGIGLALTRELVELHGGSIEAHSEGAAHGSKFVVRLPLLGTGASAGPRPESRGLVVMRRILVVDDNVDAAQTVAMLLRLVGHQVEVAYDGVTALGKVRAFRPEVMLLDIGLPDANGYQVARKLREDPQLAGVFLVALTGYGQESDVQRAREAGFDEHVTKPLDPEKLDELIARLPARRE